MSSDDEKTREAMQSDSRAAFNYYGYYCDPREWANGETKTRNIYDLLDRAMATRYYYPIDTYPIIEQLYENHMNNELPDDCWGTRKKDEVEHGLGGQKRSYEMDNGWSAETTLTNEGSVTDIHLRSPEGKVYVINETTLRAHDRNLDQSGDEAYNKCHTILTNISSMLEHGVSIETLSSNFTGYQQMEYPPEIKAKVEHQEEINNNAHNQFRRMIGSKNNNYGTTGFSTPSGAFDPYGQCNYKGAPHMTLRQDNRNLSGNMSEPVTESHMANITYEPLSTDVLHVDLSRTDYSKGIKDSTTDKIVLDFDSLVEMGFSKEEAQNLLNQTAKDLTDGKPIKEVYNNVEIILENKEKETGKHYAKIKSGQTYQDALKDFAEWRKSHDSKMATLQGQNKTQKIPLKMTLGNFGRGGMD